MPDAGSPVLLLSENLQRQFNLPATLLGSHYLLDATSNSLTTLGAAQIDTVSDHKACFNPAIVLSSLALPFILGFNFLKLSKSQIECESNNVQIGSKAYPSDIHCIKSSNSTTALTTSDVYRLCELPLNKRACLVIAASLLTVIIVIVVASHVHCNLKPPLKNQ